VSFTLAHKSNSKTENNRDYSKTLSYSRDSLKKASHHLYQHVGYPQHYAGTAIESAEPNNAGYDNARSSIWPENLQVNQPGEPYEKESDHTAQPEMQKSEPQLQRGHSYGERTQAYNLGQPGPWERLLQPKRMHGKDARQIVMPYIMHGVIRPSTGQPLDQPTRTFMEPRLGRDFSQVRIHTDDQAKRSAASLNARAFTFGNDIVFGSNAYAPRTKQGRRLIAHELAHTIQQQNVPSLPAVQTRLTSSSPADRDEQTADAAAHIVTSAQSLDGSTATRIQDHLQATSFSRPTIQRAVQTMGGEYDTDKYELASDPGMDGVAIELRFKPGKNVNAELIGMTQTVRSSQKSGPVPAGAFATTDAEKKAYESLRIPTGQPNAGTKVDQFVRFRNPLYATGATGAKDTLATTPTKAEWGQHGWRYTDKSGKLQIQDALLKDTPTLLASRKESGQVFETTALAVKGAQDGTFYGSVRWGWEKDASGSVKKLPLSLVSRGVPSATFGIASELWNKAKTSTGEETIDLPVANVKVTSQAKTQLYASMTDAQSKVTSSSTTLPAGTRFRILHTIFVLDPPAHRIEIVDGPLTGQTGYILDEGGYRDER
jgi:hypothetical protein